MTKEFKEKIIKKFSAGLQKLSILMRKLTACDEDIFIKGVFSKTNNYKNRDQFFEDHRKVLRESLSADVADKIQDRVCSAITPGYSELSMFIVSNDNDTTHLKNAYRQTYKKLSCVPDDIDIKYKDKNLNYKDVRAYTALEIMDQNKVNEAACTQLLQQTQLNQKAQTINSEIALTKQN